MRLLLSALVISLFLTSSCSNDPIDISPNLGDERVDFSELAVGQKTAYVRYSINCMTGDFELTGDEMVLEVIEEDGQMYFKESIVPQSPMFQRGEWTEDIIHPVTAVDGEVIIPEHNGSALFFFYANDRLTLNPTDMIPLEQQDCLMVNNEEVFVGDDIGQIDRFAFGELLIENKIAVSCVPPTFLELDAYLVYDKNKLLMSHSVSRNINVSVRTQGWMLKE